MTPAELKVVRESLGLSTKWVSEQLGNTERTVQRWEDTHHVPGDVQSFIEGLEQEQASQVGQYVTACMDVPDPTITTYRVDADVPDTYQYPASFHRAVVALAAKEIPGLIIEYAK